MLRHKHESESGRTSSVGHQILGYDNHGQVMNFQDKRVYGWPEVVKRSSKIVSFYDLAGHEKYLKTTIFGLSCSQPDACLIMVGGNRGVRCHTARRLRAHATARPRRSPLQSATRISSSMARRTAGGTAAAMGASAAAASDCSAASPLALAAGSIEAEVEPTEFLQMEMDGSTFSCDKFRGGAFSS